MSLTGNPPLTVRAGAPSAVPSLIDRYLIREIALTLLATTLVLLAMVLSHRLAGYLSKAANGLLARDSIFLLLGLQAVNLLTILIPLAFLLGIMLTLGRLHRDHEMTALAACGYGPLSVYRAVFLWPRRWPCSPPDFRSWWDRRSWNISSRFWPGPARKPKSRCSRRACSAR